VSGGPNCGCATAVYSIDSLSLMALAVSVGFVVARRRN
jgi:multidrug efflux pump subunit AcrB